MLSQIMDLVADRVAGRRSIVLPPTTCTYGPFSVTHCLARWPIVLS